MQHTHFASATFAAATFLTVVVFGTLWRLIWMHALTSRSPSVRGLGRAALYQF